MLVRLFAWAYGRLGRRYPVVFVAVELQSALVVSTATLLLFTLYFDATVSQRLLILAIVLVLTEATILYSLYRSMPRLRTIAEWIGGERDTKGTAEAWAAAVGLPLELISRGLPRAIPFTITPTVIAAVAILDLDWWAVFPLFAGSLVAIGYAAILHYLAVEAGMRPVLVDINSSIKGDVRPGLPSQPMAIPLRWRLLAALPLINLITGLVVAAITSGGGGQADLGIDVLVALAVTTTLSLELTVMFSKSILRPIGDLQQATEAVRHGRFNVHVPVTTGDELGELAASFNQMVAGLAERERIREAFGTYLDPDVAEYILSEGFSEKGIELEVTVMFCDVRNFTGLAAGLEAHGIVALLNGLFEVVVPIISRHGGHIDKFEGDGLLAVFGAPEPFSDHADRAVRAAGQIVRAVNQRGEAGEGVRLGIGVNTGRIVAGAIGGAGRLNFSVIGDAVNVAARVEGATRELDHDVLLTEGTKRHLSDDLEAVLVECGKQALKGVDQPIALYALVVAPETPFADVDDSVPVRPADPAEERRAALGQVGRRGAPLG